MTEKIICFSIIVACPILYFYCAHEKVFYLNKYFVSFFIIPYIFASVSQRNLTANGIKLKNVKQGLGLMAILSVIYLPSNFMLIEDMNIRQYYGKLDSMNFFHSQWKHSMEIFSTEYYFRGFLLFFLAKNLREVDAIMLQSVIYTLLHIGKPLIECLGSFPVGIALGYLALRTQSIWYGFVLHYVYGGLLLDIWRLKLT